MIGCGEISVRFFKTMQNIDGAEFVELPGADHFFHSEGGHHDHAGVGVGRAKFLEQLHPAAIGQLEVEQHHVEGPRLPTVMGLRAGLRPHHLVPLALEGLAQEVENGILVIDDEDAMAHFNPR